MYYRDSFLTAYETVHYYYHVGCCTTLFLFCFCFLSGVPAWRLISVQYNGGLLLDILRLTQCYYHRGTRLNAMKCFFLYLQPMIQPKRFDISPPDWGMLRRSRCVQIFLETTRSLVSEEKSERVSQGTVGSDLFQGNLNASRPSEHPSARGKMSKRIGGIIGCKHKTSS